MTTANVAIGGGNANHRDDRSVISFDRLVTGDGPNGQLFATVMRKARGWWQNKVIFELSAITGCTPRAAARYLAGERTADANAAFALIRSDKGPLVIETLLADLPAKRQAAFWAEMERAKKRADLRRRREEVDREEAELMRQT